jgi:L-2-hydroxyglutarate oxidase LhgO
MKEYDFIIVGGGIAGICIAEILSRDNLKILLLEKNKTLISEASTSQHGWFHFGSLYAILEDNQTLKNMLNNLINIIKYYSHFKTMNLTFSKNAFLLKKKTRLV